MARAQVMAAEQAAELIESGSTVAICGVVSLLSSEAVLRALAQRFAVTAAPRDLTVIAPCRTGWSADGATTGLEHLAADGMLCRLIASAYNARDTPSLMAAVMDGSIATYVLPMGVMYRWLRECAAQSPGLLTRVGMGTYFDPSQGDVRVNTNVPPFDLLERVEVAGESCLLLRTTRIDVAIVRGSVADENGNISLEDEPISGGVRHIAMAARTNGGRVIAVVKRIAPAGSLPPRSVEVPGIWVDAVVVDPDAIQTQIGHESAFTGARRVAPVPVPMALDQQKIILRRAAMELEQDDIVNLGVGMGSQLPSVLAEEGGLSEVTFSVEHGALGGVPAMGVPGQTGAFGAHYNPDAIVDAADLLDFYHGGGLDATLLGFAQVDGAGNVNVARFNGAVRGPGGFIDITHRTRKVLLCGTLTSGGLRTSLQTDADGQPVLQIVQEGRHRKFLKAVEQVTLHAATAFAQGCHVRVITERCVFAVDAEGLVLIEVAPGVDIDTQIRPCVDFPLRVSPECRVMSAQLFTEGPMGLTLPGRTPRAHFHHQKKES